MDTQLCTPQPSYLIVEQVATKAGLPGMGGIGPQLRQVYRRVFQVCDIEDIFYDGQRVQGMPSTWQYVQEFLLPGKQLTTQKTGKRELLLAYAGWRNLITPLPGLGKLIDDALDKEYDLGVPPSPFVYGKDPIPAQQLFGNIQVNFTSPGGKTSPTALAVYSAAKKKLEVPTQAERAQAIRRLKQQPVSR